ncbi:hypothetical protein [Stackebrandtia soli]|uniref:hypothetical protein n=1 Tax=Stackebrandtia soli TaxID=1892856 RepID=UPI0039EB7F96
MTRQSYYINREAADALDDAVDAVLAVLGPDTPRHVALSAIIRAGADRATDVAATLAEDRATELERRIAELRK